MKFLSLAAFGLLSCFCIVSCTTSAIDPTGRIQHNDASPALQSKGNQLFAQMKQKKKISRNASYNAQLQRVGRRLMRVIPSNIRNWEFVVFDDPAPNAFALPGGKVGIHSGLFPITKNDAGLAAVVGHEIAHVTANHAGARMQQATGIAIGAAVLDGILGSRGASTSTRDSAGRIYGLGSQVGASLPFSRRQETEADKMGMIYMARAGYDPAETINMWRRFHAYNNKKGRRTSEFLSTHPLDTTRIRQLESFLPIADREYRR